METQVVTGLDVARFHQTRKLDEQKVRQTPIAAETSRSFRFANAGVPAAAAGILAREFEVLLEKIAALEQKIEALSGPPHLRNIERRRG